jgi:hypothetical protein
LIQIISNALAFIPPSTQYFGDVVDFDALNYYVFNHFLNIVHNCLRSRRLLHFLQE